MNARPARLTMALARQDLRLVGCRTAVRPELSDVIIAVLVEQDHKNQELLRTLWDEVNAARVDREQRREPGDARART